MSTYAIGDIQGCLAPLKRLLHKIHFDPTQDKLWFSGDLINRGPDSLETLRFIKSLNQSALTVLGNHDLTLLAIAYEAIPYNPIYHTFKDILEAPDKNELIEWLRHQPLLHHDPTLEYTLVHAGLHPHWDLPQALLHAQAIESAIQGSQAKDFFLHLYGDTPNQWDSNLTHFEKLRFIVNVFTRLRFCTPGGKLEFTGKGSKENCPNGYFPWFSLPTRLNRHLKILFGHWAALQGESLEPNAFALDTGCVFGNCLTAMRLEDGIRFSESCGEFPANIHF